MKALSLQNPIVVESQLFKTPSNQDGIPSFLEKQLRLKGCELIQTAGIMLKLPQVAMATAQVLFQRFYYVSSLKNFAVQDTAMGAIFLAGKLSESARRLKDVVLVFHYLIQFDRWTSSETFLYHPFQNMGTGFALMKERLEVGEMQILKRLGFNVHVCLPYGLLVNYLQVLGLTENTDMCQQAWNALNDGLRTTMYVKYQPSSIACGVIYYTSLKHGIELPENPPWWEVFEASIIEVLDICEELDELYKVTSLRGIPLTCEELDVLLGKLKEKNIKLS